jgi:hypothetical protein
MKALYLTVRSLQNHIYFTEQNPSPSIIKATESCITRWTGHVIRKNNNVHKNLFGNHEEEGNLEDLSVDGMIILKWIFKI